MVIDKIKTDGLHATVEAVKNKLDTAIPMGYCNAGKVIAIGKDVTGIAPGDWVVSNGFHAEKVLAPKNLCVKFPAEIRPELAPFAILGAIGLQGIRLASPQLGENCAVIGLGLIGLLTAQLLRAQGCRVIGFDYDAQRLTLAQRFGVVPINLSRDLHPVDTALAFSRGYGVDAVFIATATQSQDPLRQAAQMSRKRGKVILLGISGLELSRADFYEKELLFQVSCSYGPGRYDSHYEDMGYDYPYPFVRWTERRNIEAVLDMLAEKHIDVAPLISHRFEFPEAALHTPCWQISNLHWGYYLNIRKKIRTQFQPIHSCKSVGSLQCRYAKFSRCKNRVYRCGQFCRQSVNTCVSQN